MHPRRSDLRNFPGYQFLGAKNENAAPSVTRVDLHSNYRLNCKVRGAKRQRTSSRNQISNHRSDAGSSHTASKISEHRTASTSGSRNSTTAHASLTDRTSSGFSHNHFTKKRGWMYAHLHQQELMVQQSLHLFHGNNSSSSTHSSREAGL